MRLALNYLQLSQKVCKRRISMFVYVLSKDQPESSRPCPDEEQFLMTLVHSMQMPTATFLWKSGLLTSGNGWIGWLWMAQWCAWGKNSQLLPTRKLTMTNTAGRSSMRPNIHVICGVSTLGPALGSQETSGSHSLPTSALLPRAGSKVKFWYSTSHACRFSQGAFDPKQCSLSWHMTCLQPFIPFLSTSFRLRLAPFSCHPLEPSEPHCWQISIYVGICWLGHCLQVECAIVRLFPDTGEATIKVFERGPNNKKTIKMTKPPMP